MASRPCLSCRRESERAAAAAATESLPALTGSERQVAWATTIRADIMRQIDAETAKGAPSAAIAAAIERLTAQTAASWWIEHRGSYAIALRAVMA